jgi:NAD(P)-dependent dehydrogenase (short-subunit alcohol dehydrogenase family)
MFSGKSAIVTGSTSGIGLGIARGLAASGANVMLNGFGDAGEIETIRQDLANGHNIKVLYSGANMADDNEIAGMIAEAEMRSAASISWSTMPGSSTSLRSRNFRSRNGMRSSPSTFPAHSTPRASRYPA